MKKIRNTMDFTKDLLLALLGAVLVLQFVGMHTKVPSGSMIPTVNIGDHLLISQLTEYVRSPEPGEIVIFYQGGDKLIKRVIAKGGDTVDLRDGDVYVNDVRVEEESYLRQAHSTYAYDWSDIGFPYEVPENYLFVMGDNREQSADSRVFGAVPEADLIAIGALKIYPFDQIGVLK